jgi:hypothetical protein
MAVLQTNAKRKRNVMENILFETRDDESVSLPPPLKLDPEKYIGSLDGYDMSEVQKHELLCVLWNIMETMVNLGLGVDTVQIILPSLTEKGVPDSVNLIENNYHQNFTAAASAGKGNAHE